MTYRLYFLVQNVLYFASIWMFFGSMFHRMGIFRGFEVVGTALNMVPYPHTSLVEYSYGSTKSPPTPTPPRNQDKSGVCGIFSHVWLCSLLHLIL